MVYFCNGKKFDDKEEAIAFARQAITDEWQTEDDVTVEKIGDGVNCYLVSNGVSSESCSELELEDVKAAKLLEARRYNAAMITVNEPVEVIDNINTDAEGNVTTTSVEALSEEALANIDIKTVPFKVWNGIADWLEEQGLDVQL